MANYVRPIFSWPSIVTGSFDMSIGGTNETRSMNIGLLELDGYNANASNVAQVGSVAREFADAMEGHFEGATVTVTHIPTGSDAFIRTRYSVVPGTNWDSDPGPTDGIVFNGTLDDGRVGFNASLVVPVGLHASTTAWEFDTVTNSQGYWSPTVTQQEPDERPRYLSFGSHARLGSTRSRRSYGKEMFRQVDATLINAAEIKTEFAAEANFAATANRAVDDTHNIFENLLDQFSINADVTYFRGPGDSEIVWLPNKGDFTIEDFATIAQPGPLRYNVGLLLRK